MNNNILGYLVSEHDYERIQYNKDELADETWESFLEWNTACVSALSAEDRTWLADLCVRMSRNMIKLVDLESCAEFQAFAFYYNKNKQLYIVNPR